MKRLFAASALLVIAALLASGFSAFAQCPFGLTAWVTDCEDYITLRDMPDTSAEAVALLPLGERVTYLFDVEERFARVDTDYGPGYVLKKYLAIKERGYGEDVLPSLSRKERYRVNVFLSNFTEADLGWPTDSFDLDDYPEMVEFCINHIWFNDQEKLEWISQGEYNVRLKAKYIPEVAMRYFGCIPASMEPKYVDYEDGYYLWQETGGHVHSGFAIANEVLRIAEDTYAVFFESFGAGNYWDNDCCYLDRASARQNHEWSGAGWAILHIDDFGDYSSFKLEQYGHDR